MAELEHIVRYSRIQTDRCNLSAAVVGTVQATQQLRWSLSCQRPFQKIPSDRLESGVWTWNCHALLTSGL